MIQKDNLPQNENIEVLHNLITELEEQERKQNNDLKKTRIKISELREQLMYECGKEFESTILDKMKEVAKVGFEGNPDVLELIESSTVSCLYPLITRLENGNNETLILYTSPWFSYLRPSYGSFNYEQARIKAVELGVITPSPLIINS